jgi:hypothetical protein
MTSVYKEIKQLYNIDSPIISNIKDSPPCDNFLLELENKKVDDKDLLELLKFHKIDTDNKNIIKIKKILYKIRNKK